jgi:phosphomevalonate kinase
MPKSGEGEQEAIQVAKWPDKLHMIPVWTGSSASTRTLVNRVNQFKKSAPTAYGRIMDRLISLSKTGCEAFQQGEIDAFLDIVKQFVNQERILGRSSGAPIVSDVHEHLSTLVDNAGGVYKPSGAGGGDIGIALCADPSTQNRILNQINESPFETLDLAIQFEGVKSTQTYEVS